MTRANDEIDHLILRIEHLIQQAANSLPREVEDLRGAIISTWYIRYLGNPAKWWGRFDDTNPAHVINNARCLGLEILRYARRRHDRALSIEEIEEFTTYIPFEWGPSDDKLKYEGGVGLYQEGAYVATDDDVLHLFEAIARRNMVGNKGGLGRVEAADLMALFHNIKPNLRKTIRLLASGYTKGDINNSHAYNGVVAVLRSALV